MDDIHPKSLSSELMTSVLCRRHWLFYFSENFVFCEIKGFSGYVCRKE